jgi:hypothetical protein
VMGRLHVLDGTEKKVGSINNHFGANYLKSPATV